MIELQITIAPEKEQVIKLLVEELGGTVVVNHQFKKTKIKSLAKKNGKTDKKPAPTFLFGKWKDFDIDPRELRKATWGR